MGEIAADDDNETTPESRYAEVSKHRYCEQCEHFSAPPNAHCTNDGTEIMELLDMETVRLLDGPVVGATRDRRRAVTASLPSVRYRRVCSSATSAVR